MAAGRKYLLGILATHPIQYYVPWYRELAKHPEVDLQVFYCHKITPREQADAGFDVLFDWDIPLLDGYAHRFLNNRSRHPGVARFLGCDTPEIARVIRESGFDAFIVHGWNMLSFWQAMIACWNTRTPLLVRGDSQLLTPTPFMNRLLRQFTHRMFIPRFNAYLSVGERAKQYYLHYGADEKKIFFAPHSVDNNFFSLHAAALESERDTLRRQWNIPEGAFVFLLAGKLISQKRPVDFIKALALTHKDLPQAFGLIAGDGPLRAKLEDLSKGAGLPVTFTGFLNQTKLPQAYAASDALVVTSHTDTWGLIVNEAMASGLPAIVSERIGCAVDLIIPGKTGEIFPCGNVEKLAEIFRDWTKRREFVKGMGRSARRFIENYSIAQTVEGTLRALRSICGQ